MNTLSVQDVVLSKRDFRKISDMVYKHCGINLHAGKKELVRARLAKLLRLGNFKTFPEYMKHVMGDKTGKEFSTLIDSLSTNLTSFYRERQHFQYMREKLLPRMMEQRRKESSFRVRGWSAGCSSGEEPYSIAMTLLEAIAGQGRWDAKVLATDISTTILETAQKGVYCKERVAPVPPLERNKYFKTRRQNGEEVFEVSKSLRDIVIFKYLNLLEGWPVKGPLDFIFCRNVIIYFDKPTQQRLISRYWDLLGPGGVLFTGHSESLTGIEHKFDYIQPTIYMKA
ncbi:MAG: protein-glutamate O-methyltransferase [Planctomycetota bacterium]|nr:protein-glutamate O-methyltransferase [Planctomycetota bacterium]